MIDQPPARADDGTFQKGVSGNPAGRPKGRKNEITELQQELEYAVRKHMTAAKIEKIVDKMVDLAVNGNTKAAKLILDKVVSNARGTDDVDNKGAGGILIRIENATVAYKREHPEPAIPADFTEVKTE